MKTILRGFFGVWVLVAALAIAVSGCDRTGGALDGAPVYVVREHAERTQEIAIGGENKEAKFSATVQYPSPYGISPDEHRRLTDFIDNMLNDGVDFTTTVEESSRNMFSNLQVQAENGALDESAKLSLEVEGWVAYADDRYFSYIITLRGLAFAEMRYTYDRKLQRVATINDIVPSNRIDRLRGYMRDYMAEWSYIRDSDLLKTCPDDWPMINEDFTVDYSGIIWQYSNEALGLGAGFMEMYVPWRKLKEIVDPSVVPSGKFADCSAGTVESDSADWWRFPFIRTERDSFAPPNPPFVGTNYPSGKVTINIEIPGQGGMSTKKYKALQKGLAAAISPHSASECNTVEEAAQCEVVHFWERLIKEWDGKSPDSWYGEFFLGTKVLYCGPEYASYTIFTQDGCPCCQETQNVVWNWRTLSSLQIDDVLTMSKTNELKLVMRQYVLDDFAEQYEEFPHSVLPEYADNWPHRFNNFTVDEKGLTFYCDAGEVVIGGKGAYETFLTWKEISPFLRSDFVIPTHSNAE